LTAVRKRRQQQLSKPGFANKNYPEHAETDSLQMGALTSDASLLKKEVREGEQEQKGGGV
jgi:hypothetical protein